MSRLRTHLLHPISLLHPTSRVELQRAFQTGKTQSMRSWHDLTLLFHLLLKRLALSTTKLLTFCPNWVVLLAQSQETLERAATCSSVFRWPSIDSIACVLEVPLS